jgi:cephalosporin hydroxylase
MSTTQRRGPAGRVAQTVRRLLGSSGNEAIEVGRHRVGKVRPMTDDEARITEAFHLAYYEASQYGAQPGRHTIDLAWLGYKTLKSPMDLWTYQELIVETRPQVIVETGTRFGGSALYLASICELVGRGRVLTVDVNADPGSPLPRHPRISYLVGSSTDPAIVGRIRERCAGKRVMVVLDSDHSAPHVRAELDAYADLVPVGGYIVVEDTNVNGHPVQPEHGPGPAEAVAEWLSGRDDFEIDESRQRFMLTLNPGGFLRRVR